MGVSTNAILFYGYCWDEEVPAEEFSQVLCDIEEDACEWSAVIAKRRGIRDPWVDYPKTDDMPYEQSRQIGDQWCAAHSSELNLWHVAKSDIKEEFGCEIDFHCSGECPMPYVAVKESVTCARRGGPEVVDVEMMHKQTIADAEWNAMLDKFMAELGIAKPDGQEHPRWWLVSYWG